MKESTVKRLREAATRGVSHFSLLFHDGYFCDYFRDSREWYRWLVEFIRTEGYQLCSYRQALVELNADVHQTPCRRTAGRRRRSDEGLRGC